ncbi:MAG: TlpA disulfide reductase family protein [Bryobacteraceae bacterium]
MAKPILMSLLLLGGTALAQSAFNACAVAPSLAPELTKAIAAAADPQLPFAARLAPLRALLDRYPADPFVNRAYLARFGGYNVRPLHDAELPRYESLHRDHPDDPAARYLFALATDRRNPKRAIDTLEKVLQESPSPWPHLLLVFLYGSIKPVDPEKALAHLRQFSQACPETLDREALQTVAAGGDDALKRQTAERLRRELAGHADWSALQAWPVLWEIEFQITPVARHEEVRARVRQDVAALRQATTDFIDSKLDVIRRGCILANDKEGRRQIAAELERVAPASAATADAVIEEWDDQNPYPDRSAAFVEHTAYAERKWQAAKAWIDRWPNYGPAWAPTFAALNADKDTIASLGRRLAAFLARNSDITIGFTDQPIDGIAERLAVAGVDLDIIPDLLKRTAESSAERLRSDQAAAVRPMGEIEITRNFKSQSWNVVKVQAILQARRGHLDDSRATLAKLLKETDAAPADTLLAWRGILDVADAALVTGSPALARDAITRMSAVLATEAAAASTPVEQRNHAQHEAEYWESRARLSELEGRSADAVAYYIRATSAIPRNFNPVGRSRMAALAEKAWTKLGGTAGAWLAYNPDAAAGQSEGQWKEVGHKIPDFSLEDTVGHPIRLANLKGQIVFINVWATWCGPCQGELPWVQRLFDALKDRPGVSVLTFNVDENPGVVGPYMSEHGFTFPVVLAHDYVDNILKVDTIPRNWIVDGQGTLRFERQAGFDDTFIKDTLEAITKSK